MLSVMVRIHSKCEFNQGIKECHHEEANIWSMSKIMAVKFWKRNALDRSVERCDGMAKPEPSVKKGDTRQGETGEEEGL